MSDLLPIRAAFVAGPPAGIVSPQDLAKINATCSAPFSADSLYVFACVMATQEMTDYSTRLAVSSLNNFAASAQSGTPYLLDHDQYGGIYGYTYAGQYDAESNEARAAVFVPRGRFPGGKDKRSSDQEIADLSAGMRRSVSVGFGGPLIEYHCDLCGNDVFSAECSHLPGMKFDGKLATATIENARLVELSGCFNGALPGAVIGKAQTLYAASRFSAKEFRGWLDHAHVPDPTRYFSVAATPATVQESTPPDTGKEKKPMNLWDKLKSAAILAGFINEDGTELAAASFPVTPAVPATKEPTATEKELQTLRDREASRLSARKDAVKAIAQTAFGANRAEDLAVMQSAIADAPDEKTLEGLERACQMATPASLRSSGRISSGKQIDEQYDETQDDAPKLRGIDTNAYYSARRQAMTGKAGRN